MSITLWPFEAHSQSCAAHELMHNAYQRLMPYVGSARRSRILVRAAGRGGRLSCHLTHLQRFSSSHDQVPPSKHVCVWAHELLCVGSFALSVPGHCPAFIRTTVHRCQCLNGDAHNSMHTTGRPPNPTMEHSINWTGGECSIILPSIIIYPQHKLHQPG